VSGTNLHAALAAARNCAPGCSEKEEVWRSGKLRLYRYRCIAKPAGAAPLLIVYALVNRPYMMDLEPDRSLIRGLLARGLDVYLVDWGYPDGADRFITLADYIEDLLCGCVDEILKIHRLDALNILGVCQGGVFSLCFAALHPERVRNLITMVTPVDFHTSADRRAGLGGDRQCLGRCSQSAVSIADALSADAAEVRGAVAREHRCGSNRELHARRTLDLRQPGSGGGGVP
jgi:class III poly(R)-hydroxyalkanoic acid synthase PhaC subunit